MKTASLETAKQLKEIGFPQESYFVWVIRDIGSGDYLICTREQLKAWQSLPGQRDIENYAAPTAEEVLDQLPYFFETKKSRVEIPEVRPHWLVIAGHDFPRHKDGNPHIASGETLAEAAAKMWLYLKKENLI